MLILTHDTLRNPAILRVRQLPRKFFGRVAVWPKGQLGLMGTLRLLAEFQLLRYAMALSPLVIIALIWNEVALPMSGAPILMMALIWWVEMRLLRVSPAKRARLIDPADAARGLDLLKVQSRDVLTRIAALRGMQAGELHLVVEQSDLGLFAPLTFVSVQSETGPEVLRLTAQEREVITQRLFVGALSEGLLLRINQSENTFLRDITFDARGVSAHARLAAALS